MPRRCDSFGRGAIRTRISSVAGKAARAFPRRRFGLSSRRSTASCSLRESSRRIRTRGAAMCLTRIFPKSMCAVPSIRSCSKRLLRRLPAPRIPQTRTPRRRTRRGNGMSAARSGNRSSASSYLFASWSSTASTCAAERLRSRWLFRLRSLCRSGYISLRRVPGSINPTPSEGGWRCVTPSTWA